MKRTIRKVIHFFFLSSLCILLSSFVAIYAFTNPNNDGMAVCHLQNNGSFNPAAPSSGTSCILGCHGTGYCNKSADVLDQGGNKCTDEEFFDLLQKLAKDSKVQENLKKFLDAQANLSFLKMAHAYLGLQEAAFNGSNTRTGRGDIARVKKAINAQIKWMDNEDPNKLKERFPHLFSNKPPTWSPEVKQHLNAQLENFYTYIKDPSNNRTKPDMNTFLDAMSAYSSQFDTSYQINNADLFVFRELVNRYRPTSVGTQWSAAQRTVTSKKFSNTEFYDHLMQLMTSTYSPRNFTKEDKAALERQLKSQQKTYDAAKKAFVTSFQDLIKTTTDERLQFCLKERDSSAQPCLDCVLTNYLNSILPGEPPPSMKKSTKTIVDLLAPTKDGNREEMEIVWPKVQFLYAKVKKCTIELVNGQYRAKLDMAFSYLPASNEWQIKSQVEGEPDTVFQNNPLSPHAEMSRDIPLKNPPPESLTLQSNYGNTPYFPKHDDAALFTAKKENNINLKLCTGYPGTEPGETAPMECKEEDGLTLNDAKTDCECIDKENQKMEAGKCICKDEKLEFDPTTKKCVEKKKQCDELINGVLETDEAGNAECKCPDDKPFIIINSEGKDECTKECPEGEEPEGEEGEDKRCTPIPEDDDDDKPAKKPKVPPVARPPQQGGGPQMPQPPRLSPPPMRILRGID